MRHEIYQRLIFVLLLALLAGFLAPPDFVWKHFLGQENTVVQKLDGVDITLGLDLAGGTELDYRIDLSEAEAQNADDDPANDVNIDSIAESVRDALEARVNPAGVSEVIVKRAQMNGEEHVLIQLPPSANVAQAKADAERDNRLEFFEEDPGLEKTTRVVIAKHLAEITPENFDQKKEELTQNPNVEYYDIPARFIDEFDDPALVEELAKLEEGEIYTEIADTQSEMLYTMGPDGGMQLMAFPEPVLAIVRLREKTEEERETTTEPQAHARHILFGYSGALRAPEDTPYATKEDAQAKAQEVLAQLQDGGDFAELAKEFSTGPTKDKGGDLGTFAPGAMVEAFNDAVFERTEPGLIPELIETPFGFHLIEVLELTPEETKTETATKVAYDMIGWKKNDIVWRATELSGAQLENASVGYDQVNRPLVNLLFDADGGRMFEAITGRVAGRDCGEGTSCRLGIQVGGEWVTQPTVSEQIHGRTAQITGNFTFASAKDLADGLNLGAIDAPVVLSGQTTVQPELGFVQLQRSLQAGMYGIIATMIFMLVVYRFAGIVAGLALALYAGMFPMILKLWPNSFGGPIVLTLSGIAGLILSLGLAVDGNILIFERMKEEFRRGRGLQEALDLGFARAWTAIRDSNLTTLLVCVILFALGSSLIKGFAVMLIIGTILSMFTAIFISRTLLRFFLLFAPFRVPALYGFGFHKGKGTEKTTKTTKTPVHGAKIRTRKKKKS